MQKVIDTHCFEHKNGMRKILPLNLGNRSRKHLRLVCSLCVETETFSGSCSPSTTSPLFRLGLRDWCHYQRIHTKFWIVCILFHKARVDHIVDLVNRD